jgi:hypothetical protein
MSPKNVPTKQANLAREVYRAAFDDDDEARSFVGEVGEGLAYLLGAILENGIVTFREQDDVVLLLAKKFPPKHPVWKHVIFDSEWFGGVDVHHVFFEGLHEDVDGVWVANWGS